MSGFRPDPSQEAWARHVAVAKKKGSKASILDFDWGDGTDGQAVLSAKNMLVVTALKGDVSVYAVQELGACADICSVLAALLSRHGLGVAYSPPAAGDTAAGVLIAWRLDMWTLQGRQVVDDAGRILTVRLRSTVDLIDYYFTCVYLHSASHSTLTKRECGAKLQGCALQHTVGPVYFCVGDFNGPPPAVARNSGEENTNMYAKLIEECGLVRLSDLTNTYFRRERRANATVYRLDWETAKDKAREKGSVAGLSPDRNRSCYLDLIGPGRFVLYPTARLAPERSGAHPNEAVFLEL